MSIAVEHERFILTANKLRGYPLPPNGGNGKPQMLFVPSGEYA